MCWHLLQKIERVVLHRYQDGVERFEVRNAKYSTIKHSTIPKRTWQITEESLYPAELFSSLYKFTVIRNTYYRVMFEEELATISHRIAVPQ